MDEQSTLVWSRAALFAVSMTALGRAIQIWGGELGGPPYPTITWLTIAILDRRAGGFPAYGISGGTPPISSRRWDFASLPTSLS